MSWKQKHDKLRERVYSASGAKSISAFDKQVTRAATGLTTEEALFLLANKYRVGASREFERLPSDSRQRVSNRINQNVAVNTTNTTKNVKIDKRTLINNSPVHNLSFGDRNKVSQSVVSMYDNLAALIEQIDKSDALTENEKSDYKSDIETIASQIGKSKPNRTIIKSAWESVKALGEIEGFIQFITQITPLLHKFIK